MQRKNAKFRFQDLEIWKLAIEIGDKLFRISNLLEKNASLNLRNN